MGLFGSGPKEQGELDHYTVMYLGGLPAYPKSNSSPLLFKICNDRFVMHPTFGANWFKAFTIPYQKVQSVDLARRQAGLLEVAMAGADSTQLNTSSIVQVSFADDRGVDLVMRLQMISGLSAQGQAVKAAEMLDLLRSQGILQKFKTTRPTESHPSHAEDIPSQIEKLSQLRDKGILSNEEFMMKKVELLKRM